jgi:hypothetical protein
MRLFIVFLILLCNTLSSAGDEKMRMAFAFATAAEVEIHARPLPPAPQPVAKTCLCSGLCECGCNDGEPCDCHGANPVSTRTTKAKEGDCHTETAIVPVFYQTPTWSGPTSWPAAYSPVRTQRSPINLFRSSSRGRGGNCSS